MDKGLRRGVEGMEVVWQGDEEIEKRRRIDVERIGTEMERRIYVNEIEYVFRREGEGTGKGRKGDEEVY